MSQERILKWLKRKYPKKYSVRELQDRLGIRYSSIYQNINRLLKDKSILSEERIFPDKRHTYSIYSFNPDPLERIEKKIHQQIAIRPLKDMIEIGVMENVREIHCMRYLTLMEKLNFQVKMIQNNIKVVSETGEGLRREDWRSFEGRKKVLSLMRKINKEILALNQIKIRRN